MTIAPDGGTFWSVGEYAKNNGNFTTNWGLWVASYIFPGCPPLLFEDGFESGDLSRWAASQP